MVWCHEACYGVVCCMVECDIISALLAGGRDPSECWSRGSQILGATNMTLAGEGGWYLYLILQLMTSVTQVTFTEITYMQILPSLVIDIQVAPKIWEPRDQHSPGSLPPARSVEKRAWV